VSSRNGSSSSARLLAWLATPSGIGTLFIVGLAIRLALAGAEGFPTDMSAFKAWAGRLAERGPWDFYPTGGEEYFVDYPPGYLYVLWALGRLARAFNGGVIPDIWIKLPPIFADLGLAWVAMVGAQRIAPAAVVRRVPVRAFVAGAILLNPAIFFISAVWGQADSVVAVIVLGGLVLLGTGPPTLRREAAGMALLAVAIGTKPQAAFVVPVAILVLCWRHVRGRLVEAEDPETRKREGRLGALRVAFLGGVGVLAGFALFAPFRLFPARAFEFYADASRTYRVTSVFAFNLWGAVGFWRPDSGSDAVRFLGLPVVIWGLVALVALGALVLARVWVSLRRGVDQGRVLVFGSMALTLVGFAVVTRIHERYLFLPLALGAMLVTHRFLRRAFLALSLAYLVNVLFPYVYYVEREGLPAPKFWGFFDTLYGTDIGSANMRLLSLAITALCLWIVFAGWRSLESAPGSHGPLPDVAEDVARERSAWTIDLHEIGRRNAWIALAVFAVALLSRVAGLGHPPGMYFDEVYHARTGAEYLGNEEVFEYTHPPFAKEVMGFAIQHLSGFGAKAGGALPDGIDAHLFTSRPEGVAWARDAEGGSAIQLGRIDGGCNPRSIATMARTDITPDALVVTSTGAMLAGRSADLPVMVRIEDGEERWRANLPSPAAAIASVDDRSFVVTTEGELVTVSPEGEPHTLAVGASQLSAAAKEVWVSFPDDEKIAAWDAERKRTAVIQLDGAPRAIAAPEDVERVFVAVGDSVLSYDTETKSQHASVTGAADLLGTVGETTAVWAVAGSAIRVIEPHSGVVIGRLSFPRAPDVLSSDLESHRLVGIADGRLECASGRPQFAWRLGSAFAGSAMVVLAFLLALRLFGSRAAALLASLFLLVDGLAFTISRIAMNDSYTTVFIMAAWFCILSAMRVSLRRYSALGWLAACGVFAGLGLASKWVALYAIAGIGLLLLWDAFARREGSIWRVAGGFGTSALVLAFFLGVIPLAIYVLTYTPYFGLGHDVGEFFKLQRDMFSYHANLTASHPFGSPWWGWPLGYRAVFLYLAGSGESRSEIWTIPNLAVMWGGLVAMVAAFRRAWTSREVALGVVLLAAAVQYVPWIAVSRVTFMYHFLPVVPWLAIALGWFLAVGLRDWRYQKVAIVAVTVSTVAVFGFLYPILVGWEMSDGYLEMVRELFPWVI
jgi:Gpi18-like mannosyltransferase/predicted membrane-bound dolichyl-phosphate-mannose-protein mannosyltransferase